MPIHTIQGSKRRLAALAGLVLATGIVTATPLRAEVLPVSEMLRGITITQAQCAAIPQTVWVNAMGQIFCIRYFMSTIGGAGRRPVVFLQGDQFGRLDGTTRNFNPPPDTKDTNTDDLIRFADSFSKMAGTTAIYLARIGVDGSSGHHRVRHSVLELYAMDAALEAIKKRHQFEGFHLVGQSGGATLVGGLLALREDIACAVPGAGRLAHLNKQKRPATDPALEVFDPYDAIPRIAQNRAARVILVTDPEDKKVQVQHQTTFAQGLEQAGKPVEQVMVQATDENRHGMVAYARLAVSMCAKGATKEAIENNLKRLAEKRRADARCRPEQPNRRTTNETHPSPAIENTHPPARATYPRRAGDPLRNRYN